jgi:hypothetical protein
MNTKRVGFIKRRHSPILVRNSFSWETEADRFRGNEENRLYLAVRSDACGAHRTHNHGLKLHAHVRSAPLGCSRMHLPENQPTCLPADLGLSWAAPSRLATQKFAKMLCNPAVHYGSHKNRPLISILSQINPVHDTPILFSYPTYVFMSW